MSRSADADLKEAFRKEAFRKEPRDWVSLVLGLFVGVIIAAWALWLVGTVLDRVLNNYVPEVTSREAVEYPSAKEVSEAEVPPGNPADALMSPEDVMLLRLREQGR